MAYSNGALIDVPKEQLAAEYLRARIRDAWEYWDATIAPRQGDPRRQFEALLAGASREGQCPRGRLGR
jgi:hypothetical protein